jgi:rhodanese-related sulfurtransferase
VSDRPLEIRPEEVAQRLRRSEPVWLLDVRNDWEHQLVRLEDHAHVPLQELPSRLDEVQPPPGALVVCYCHHGIRSLSAAALLRQARIDNAVSLQGGIERWSEVVDPTVQRY